jgi:hypothetical protein
MAISNNSRKFSSQYVNVNICINICTVEEIHSTLHYFLIIFWFKQWISNKDTHMRQCEIPSIKIVYTRFCNVFFWEVPICKFPKEDKYFKLDKSRNECCGLLKGYFSNQIATTGFHKLGRVNLRLTWSGVINIFSSDRPLPHTEICYRLIDYLIAFCFVQSLYVRIAIMYIF